MATTIGMGANKKNNKDDSKKYSELNAKITKLEKEKAELNAKIAELEKNNNQ